ncbi:glycoside hydrolase [Lactifluus subvellereus]|nr:glycoside hydrolase [Lactifluus subvellereus]
MGLSLIPILALVALARSVPNAGRSPSGSKAVIAQMFEWNWDSVAAECTSFLGPAGYGFVQVSPAQEHVQGPEWWTDYQPVSYTLTSKRGTREQYKAMIQTCHTAGVKVIADTLWNHMTARSSGTGVAGSSFEYYVYPGIYQYQDFHHCRFQTDHNIADYSNKAEVWTCQLGGLADLATETEYVRWRLATYTNDLIYLGVDGLRLDAAKHMDPADIANISSRLTTKPYITQEVIWGAGGAVTPDMYTGNGDVQEFRYTTSLMNSFLSTGISSLQNLDNQGWVAGSGANVFVCNHDTERHGQSLNAYSPSNTYTLATVFSLAHPYGTPSVLSSYTNFYNADAGGPKGGSGACSGNIGVDGWFCQHRWPAISGMVGFRNHVGNAPLTYWVSPSSQQVAFGRGSLGFVAINNADSAWSTTFATGLPGGSYCNVIDGSSLPGVCCGSAFSIASDGSLTVSVGPRQAIAVHTGAPSSGACTPTAQQIPIMFSESATTTPGENIFVVGSLPQLGTWNSSNAIPLDPVHYPVWGATVYLPPHTTFEFRFIRKESDGNIVWESNPNRQDTTPSSGVQSIVTSWR